MAVGKKKSAIPTKKESNNQPNIWAFGIEVFKLIFQLFNNGVIFPIFGLVLVFSFLLIVYKIPNSEVAGLIKFLVEKYLTGNSAAYLMMLILTNIGWPVVFIMMRNVYKGEIDRLTNVRSELMHLEERRKINDHRSSKGDVVEKYVFKEKNNIRDESDEESPCV